MNKLKSVMNYLVNATYLTYIGVILLFCVPFAIVRKTKYKIRFIVALADVFLALQQNAVIIKK